MKPSSSCSPPPPSFFSSSSPPPSSPSFQPSLSPPSSSSPHKKEEKAFDKFRTNSFMAKLTFYKNRYNFEEGELLTIKKRFNKISENGLIDKRKYRESLGLLGLENAIFLSDRIFLNIDDDGDGMATYEDFLNYMNILINGDERSKALLSFHILDSNRKGKISYLDIEKMLYGISALWNSITSSKIVPTKNYIDYIFKRMDKRNRGAIEFCDFLEVYKEESGMYFWFEFFNQDSLEFTPEIKKVGNNPSLFQLFAPSCLLSYATSSCLMGVSSGLAGEIKEMKKLIEARRKERKEERIRLENHRREKEINREEERRRKMMEGKEIGWRKEEKGGREEVRKGGREEGEGLMGKVEGVIFVKRPNIGKSQILSKKGEDEFDNPPYNEEMDGKERVKRKESEEEERRKKSGKEEEFLFDLERRLQNMEDKVNEMGELKREEVEGKKVSKNQIGTRRSTVKNMPRKSLKAKGAKKNMGIYFGHENWNLVLNMLIGIRTSVKSIYDIDEKKPVEEFEFQMQGHFELIQKRISGFDISKACKFYDYAPNVFSRIRRKFGLLDETYLRSIGPENLLGSMIMGDLASLTELMSSGKSGSFFYFTGDSRFMMKTISRDEFTFFRKILRPYYYHLSENTNTLLTRIYGLHKIKIFKSKSKTSKIYFVIMGNLFLTSFELDLRYDLKGSRYGRSSKNENWNKSIALKDLDFEKEGERMEIEEGEGGRILREIGRDVEFLKKNKVIDYSLLIGIHNITLETKRKIDFKFEKDEHARPHETFHGGILSKDHSKIYYIGIIDILTEFGAKKKLEYGFKKAFFGGEISCIPAEEYGKRFYNFLNKNVFK